jgi:hypothetical protein
LVLAVLTGALPMAVLLVVGLVALGFRPLNPGDPFPGQELFDPTLLFALVAAPLTMHAARLAARRSSATVSAATGPASPAA